MIVGSVVRPRCTVHGGVSGAGAPEQVVSPAKRALSEWLPGGGPTRARRAVGQTSPCPPRYEVLWVNAGSTGGRTDEAPPPYRHAHAVNMRSTCISWPVSSAASFVAIRSNGIASNAYDRMHDLSVGLERHI